MLWIRFAAANRDPDVFDAPDEMQPGRANAKQDLTFGYGIHYCIGEPLARMQIRHALAYLPARFPTLRLVGDEVDELPNHALRSTLAVHVTAD